MPGPIQVRIADDLRRRHLWSDGQALLVATSGGADSTALLLLLRELGMAVTAGLIDHGHRDMSRERGFLDALCQAQAIPFLCRVARAGRTDESSLRRARHRALAELACELGISVIALAHTADDQVETVLMRIFRGTSIRGLAGIPRMRSGFSEHGANQSIRVVRPLLHLPRAELRTWLVERDIEPVEDPSNQDPRYLRNHIRLGILPALRRLNPRVSEAILRLADNAAETFEFLETEAKHAALRTVDQAGDPAPKLDIEDLEKLPTVIRLELIRSWIRGLSGRRGEISRAHIKSVERLCGLPGNAEVTLPGGIRVRKHRSMIERIDFPEPYNSQGMVPGPADEGADPFSL